MTSISRTTMSCFPPVHLCGDRELEFADSLRFYSELSAAHTARINSYCLFWTVVDQRKPIIFIELQAHLAGLARVVIDRDGNRNPIALRQRNRQVQIDKEILKDFQA